MEEFDLLPTAVETLHLTPIPVVVKQALAERYYELAPGLVGDPARRIPATGVGGTIHVIVIHDTDGVRYTANFWLDPIPGRVPVVPPGQEAMRPFYQCTFVEIIVIGN